MNLTDFIINLKYSKIFFSLLLLVTLLTAVIIFFMPIKLIYQIILSTFTDGYAVAIFFQEYKNPIIKLIYDRNGWQWMDSQGVFQAELCGDSTLTSFVSVLRFKVLNKKRKRSCVIFFDSVEKSEYKKLLVAVKYMV